MDVDLHMLRLCDLEGRTGALRALVAPRYLRGSETGTERSRLEALGAGLLLREVLGVEEDEQLSYGESGKPRLSGGGPEFNLSHGGGLVVLGVAKGMVGVDVQAVPSKLRPVEMLLARKYFSPEDLVAIGDGSREVGRLAFARAWVRLEACLKAGGTGFYVDPRRHPEVLDAWELAYHETDGCVIAVAAAEAIDLRVHGCTTGA